MNYHVWALKDDAYSIIHTLPHPVGDSRKIARWNSSNAASKYFQRNYPSIPFFTKRCTGPTCPITACRDALSSTE